MIFSVPVLFHVILTFEYFEALNHLLPGFAVNSCRDQDP